MYFSVSYIALSTKSNSIVAASIISGCAITYVLDVTYFSTRSPETIANRYPGTGIVIEKNQFHQPFANVSLVKFPPTYVVTPHIVLI